MDWLNKVFESGKPLEEKYARRRNPLKKAIAFVEGCGAFGITLGPTGALSQGLTDAEQVSHIACFLLELAAVPKDEIPYQDAMWRPCPGSHLLKDAHAIFYRVHGFQPMPTSRNDEESCGTPTLVRDGILKVLRSMDINRHAGGSYAAGWANANSGEVVIPIENLIAELGKVLPSDLTNLLELDADTKRFDHPAIQPITAALALMGLLLVNSADVSSATGLFTVRVGQIKFRACVLMNRAVLAQLLPGVVETWGDAGCPVKVVDELTHHETESNSSAA